MNADLPKKLFILRYPVNPVKKKRFGCGYAASSKSAKSVAKFPLSPSHFSPVTVYPKSGYTNVLAVIVGVMA